MILRSCNCFQFYQIQVLFILYFIKIKQASGFVVFHTFSQGKIIAQNISMISQSQSLSQNQSKLQKLSLNFFQLERDLLSNYTQHKNNDSLKKVSRQLTKYIAAFDKKIIELAKLQNSQSQQSDSSRNDQNFKGLIDRFKSIQQFLSAQIIKAQSICNDISENLNKVSLERSQLLEFQTNKSISKNQIPQQISSQQVDLLSQPKPQSQDFMEPSSNEELKMKLTMKNAERSEISSGRNKDAIVGDVLKSVDLSSISMKDVSLADRKRFFDKFEDFQAKVNFYILLCEAILYKATKKNSRRLQTILKYVIERKLKNQLFDNIRYSGIKTMMQTIATRIFLMCLYVPDQNDKKSIAYEIEEILKKLEQYQRDNKVQDFIQSYKHRFCFDNDPDNMTPLQNENIFKYTVYFITNKIDPQSFKTIIRQILKNQQLFQVNLNNLSEIDKKFEELEQQEDKQKKPLLFEDQSTRVSDNSIFQSYENLPVYGDYFYFKNNSIGFDTSQFRRGIKFDAFDLDKFLNIKEVQRLDIFASPNVPIGFEGLRKICFREPWKLKELQVWNCSISTLQGSGLQRLNQLRLLSLSNNPLKKDSVIYLLKHKWSKLTDLRLTFHDGSQSWDMLQQRIEMPFPNLRVLYMRQCRDVNTQTLKRLIQLRETGITFYFRIQKQYIHVLDSLQLRSFDFDNEVENVELSERWLERFLHKLSRKLKNINLDQNKLIEIIKGEITQINKSKNLQIISAE